MRVKFEESIFALQLLSIRGGVGKRGNKKNPYNRQIIISIRVAHT